MGRVSVLRAEQEKQCRVCGESSFCVFLPFCAFEIQMEILKLSVIFPGPCLDQ